MIQNIAIECHVNVLCEDELPSVLFKCCFVSSRNVLDSFVSLYFSWKTSSIDLVTVNATHLHR